MRHVTRLTTPLGAYLFDLRGKLTQAEAAEKAGLQREVWNALERGRRGLGDDVAARIAAGFNRPPAELQPFITQRGTPQGEDLRAEVADLRDRLDRAEKRIGSLGRSVGVLRRQVRAPLRPGAGEDQAASGK